MFGRKKIEELTKRVYDLEQDVKIVMCDHELKDRKLVTNWCNITEECGKCGKFIQIIVGIDNISKRRIEISKGIIKEEKAKLKEK